METWQWLVLSVPAAVLVLSVAMITRILLAGKGAAPVADEPEEEALVDESFDEDEADPWRRPAEEAAELTDEPVDEDALDLLGDGSPLLANDELIEPEVIAADTDQVTVGTEATPSRSAE